MNLGGPAQQAALLSGRRLDPGRYETLLVHGSVAAGEESMADLAHREGARAEFVPSLSQPQTPLTTPPPWRGSSPSPVAFAPTWSIPTWRRPAFSRGWRRLRPALPSRHRPHLPRARARGLLRPASGLYRSLEALLGRRSDCLIGVSQATVDDLVRLGVAARDRFRVIPLGLDLEPFATSDPVAGRELRRGLGIGEDDVVLSFVGRVVPIKRVDVLLRALALAKDAAPLRLLVVGDGEIRPPAGARASSGSRTGCASSAIGATSPRSPPPPTSPCSPQPTRAPRCR